MRINPLNRNSRLFDKRQLAWLFILATFLTPLPAAEKERDLPSLSVMNHKNMSVRLSSLKEKNEILVLVFVASTCPVTHLYWERIKGTWYNYRDRDVVMMAVGGNSDDSIEKIQKQFETLDLELPIVWDSKHALARAVGIEFTPGVVVIGKNWETLYRGRIDDFWRDEARVKQRYLDAAITAALSGHKIPDHVNEDFMGSRLR